MSISSPLLLLIVPIIAGIGAYLLRRWRLATVLFGVGILIFLSIALMMTQTDLQSIETSSEPLFKKSWLILGQSFAMDQVSRDVLLIVTSGLGFLILLTLPLNQGSLFVALSLLALSPLAGVLMAESISISATFLLVAAAVLTILIQSERAGSTLSSFRYLTLAVLVFPILLTIEWMLEGGPAQFLTWIPFLLLVGFLVLFFSFPFHIWVSPTISESQSLVPVIVFGLAQLVVVYFLFGLIVENPIFYGNVRLLQLLRASGAATLILATALLLTASSLSRLFGYLLLIDLGSTAIALGLGGKIGLEMVSYLVMIRLVGLLMAGFGLGMIRRHLNSIAGDAYQSFKVRNLVRHSPLGLALIIYGGLSLAGMPLTPGFAGRWSLVKMAGDQDQWLAFIIVIAVASAGIGLARMLLPNGTRDEEQTGSGFDETRTMHITAGILLAVGVLFALISPVVLTLSQNLVNGR